MERTCRKCGETKPIEEFSKRSDTIYRHHCKECKKKYGANYYNINRDKIREKEKIYRQENKEKIRVRDKKRNQYPERKAQKRLSCKRYIERIGVGNMKIRRKQYRKDNYSHINVCETDRGIKKRYELKDCYVVAIIGKVTGLPYDTIRKNPKLIESWRQQIKVKRLLKQKKDENNETG